MTIGIAHAISPKSQSQCAPSDADSICNADDQSALELVHLEVRGLGVIVHFAYF